MYTGSGILPPLRRRLETAERTDMPRRGRPDCRMRSYLVRSGFHHLYATDTFDLEPKDQQASENGVVCHFWLGNDNVYMWYSAHVLRRKALLL